MLQAGRRSVSPDLIAHLVLTHHLRRSLWTQLAQSCLTKNPTMTSLITSQMSCKLNPAHSHSLKAGLQGMSSCMPAFKLAAHPKNGSLPKVKSGSCRALTPGYANAKSFKIAPEQTECALAMATLTKLSVLSITHLHFGGILVFSPFRGVIRP